MAQEKTKICKRCGVSTPISQFRKDPRLLHGRRNICHQCRRDADNNRYGANKAAGRLKQKKVNLKHTYGISLEQFYSMCEAQEHRCKTCNAHQSELSQSLCVDHDHKTGKIRGLLCKPCNSALGFTKENKATLVNLINYINFYSESPNV